MSESYPLHWPVGWKRCGHRTGAKFTTTKASLGRAKQKLSIRDGIRRVIDELGRMGVKADDVIISHNVKPHIMDTQGSNVSDPGVAVYWKKRGQPDRVVAVDRYFTVADNLAAIAATLDAMRAIERHGGAVVMERAFSGFDALPPPSTAAAPQAWWQMHSEHVLEARAMWAEQHFAQLVRFRNDGASMSEGQFQQHLEDTPGFRAWCEREGVPT